jgi:hypothetical protein
MEPVLVIGWLVLVAVALAWALVTRRGTAWAALAILGLPAAWLWLGVRYGTG